MSRTPAVLAAGAFSLALMLTACGDDTPDEETTVSAEEQEEEGTGTLQDLLANISGSTTEITNYTLTVESVGEDPDFGEVGVTATYEVMDDPVMTRETWVMPFLGETFLPLFELAGEDVSGLDPETLGTIIMIYPDGEPPLTSNPMDLEAETEWTKGEAGTAEEVADSFDVESLPDLVATFAEIEQIEKSGTEEINGVETTVIGGTMTEEEFDALEAEQKLAVIELMDSVTETVDVTLWVGDDGFPHRMEFATEENDVSMEFSEIGTTSFELPDDSEITVL